MPNNQDENIFIQICSFSHPNFNPIHNNYWICEQKSLKILELQRPQPDSKFLMNLKSSFSSAGLRRPRFTSQFLFRCRERWRIKVISFRRARFMSQIRIKIGLRRFWLNIAPNIFYFALNKVFYTRRVQANPLKKETTAFEAVPVIQLKSSSRYRLH